MSQIITRFRPTSGNGPLHVGHLVNAYAAFLFAKKHGGEFLVICDPMYLVPGVFQDFPPDEAWPAYRANWELLGRLFPGKENTKGSGVFIGKSISFTINYTVCLNSSMRLPTPYILRPLIFSPATEPVS